MEKRSCATEYGVFPTTAWLLITFILSVYTPSAAATKTTVDVHVDNEATILRRGNLHVSARDVTAVTTYTQMGVTVSAFGTNTVPGQVHFVSYCEDKALAFQDGSYVLDAGAIRSAASWGSYAVREGCS